MTKVVFKKIKLTLTISDNTKKAYSGIVYTFSAK